MSSPYFDFTQIDSVWKNLEYDTEKGLHFYNEREKSFRFYSFSVLYRWAMNLVHPLNELLPSRESLVAVTAETNVEFILLWIAINHSSHIIVPIAPCSSFSSDFLYLERVGSILKEASLFLGNNNECSLVSSHIESKEIISFCEEKCHDDSPTPPHPSLSKTAFIQFTSGSTGIPKGILITFENLIASIDGMWQRIGVDCDRDKAASWLPLYHDMGLVGYLLGCLLTRTTLYLQSPLHFSKRPVQFMQFLADEKISICSMSNFGLEWVLKRFARKKQFSGSLESLSWLGIGAEPISTEIVRQFKETFSQYGLRSGVLSPCYGLAEATLGVTIEKRGVEFCSVQYDGSSFVTNGSPLHNIEVSLSEKEPCTVLIKGPAVASRALVRGEEISLIDEQGWYDTMDMGLFHNERLVILGRADEMFIVNGENYFPATVEESVRSSEYIFRNRCVCFPYKREHDQLVVFLFETSLKEPREIAEIESIIKREIFSRSGVTIDVVQAVPPKGVPVTPSGKVQRKKSRMMYEKMMEEIEANE